jgi:arylsulfatase A-like enzyme
VKLPPSHYFAQASCTLKQIVRLVDNLKDLGRFEDSAIIIHADHGNLTRCVDVAGRVMSEATSRKMKQVSMNGRSGVEIDCWSRALLLVKRPGVPASAEFEVSDRRTQLLDLRATIRAMAGMQGSTTAGVDIFAKPFPEHRPLSLVGGSYQPAGPTARHTNRRGRELKFVHLCQHIESGELNHFVNGPGDEGWSIERNLRVKCE